MGDISSQVPIVDEFRVDREATTRANSLADVQSTGDYSPMVSLSLLETKIKFHFVLWITFWYNVKL